MPKAGYDPSRPTSADNVGPAFALSDLELIGSTDIPGITFLLILSAEYADEEIAAMIEVRDWEQGGTRSEMFCSFHRCSKAIRIEFSGTRFQVMTVTDALACIRRRAPKQEQPRIAPGKHTEAP